MDNSIPSHWMLIKIQLHRICGQMIYEVPNNINGTRLTFINLGQTLWVIRAVIHNVQIRIGMAEMVKD